jgi:hypothetical protein
LRNITVEGLDTFLKYHLYGGNIWPEIAFGGYGTMMQDVLAEDGLLQRKDADLVVLSLALDELTARLAGARRECRPSSKTFSNGWKLGPVRRSW